MQNLVMQQSPGPGVRETAKTMLSRCFADDMMMAGSWCWSVAVLYNDSGQRRGWIFGLLAVGVALLGYLLNPYHYFIPEGMWIERLPLFETNMALATFFAIGSFTITASSIRIGLVLIIFASAYIILWYVSVVPRVDISRYEYMVNMSSYLLAGVGVAAGAALIGSVIEGSAWAWRDPSKKF